MGPDRLKMFKDFLKNIYPKKYRGLNQLDRKLEKFVDYDSGYYVELGANDGITQSNSFYFERKRNWKGVLIEPYPQNYINCRKNRSPENFIYCAACVSFDYLQEFVRIAHSNLMSTSLSLPSDISNARAHAELGKKFLPPGEVIFEYGAVARTLNSLLDEASAPKYIDFLSLDVEGAELEVLRGINHDLYRFKYMLIECRDFQRIDDYLKKHNYSFIEKLSEQDYLFTSKV